MQNKPMKLLIIEDDVIDCKNFINAIENRKDIELVAVTDSDIEGLKYTKLTCTCQFHVLETLFCLTREKSRIQSSEKSTILTIVF